MRRGEMGGYVRRAEEGGILEKIILSEKVSRPLKFVQIGIPSRLRGFARTCPVTGPQSASLRTPARVNPSLACRRMPVSPGS